MRTRRRFQPSLDFLSQRITPSDVGVAISPMDPLDGTSDPGSTVTSPMDPLSGGTDSDPSVTDPTMIGPGSYTPTPITESPC